MLLISLTNLFGQNEFKTSFTGNIKDTLVTLPISTIRFATIKLIERNEYKELCFQKDSIIKDYKEYISLQENKIQNLKIENYDLLEKNNDYIKINEDIAKDLIKQKRLTMFAGGVATVGIITTIILILIK